MIYEIRIHPKAAEEIDKLDNSLKIPVLKQIKKLSRHPELGLPLGNKQGLDLSGYRKLYAENKRIRIVYKIFEEKIIVRIVAVGKREDMKVYKEAAVRIVEDSEL